MERIIIILIIIIINQETEDDLIPGMFGMKMKMQW